MNQPQPRYWRKLERHPLSADYENIEGPAWEQFVADLKAAGIINRRKVTLHEGKVLDGWQLQRACVEAGIRPDYQPLPKNVTAEDYVRICNDNRRHETPDMAHKRAEERRQRVAAAREQGQSQREIAEKEGVSQKQVRRDLAASGETGASPGPPNGEVKGRDGKIYQASKPEPEPILCGRCKRTGAVKDCSMCRDERESARTGRQPGDEDGPKTRPEKNGRVKYDWKVYQQLYGGLHREVTKLSKVHHAKDCDDARELIDDLAKWDTKFRAFDEKRSARKVVDSELI